MRSTKAATPSSTPMDAPDPLDTREQQLLAIARALFARHGYDRTSLRDIAEEAKITKAALYYYFPNKDALFERIVLESIQSLYDDASAAVARAGTPTERIRAFMEASANVQDHARDRWIAGSNAFWQGAKEGQRLAALRLRDSYENLLRRCITEGVACGELRPVDPAMAGRLLLSALNYMPRWHQPGGKLSAAEAMQQFMDMLMHGLVQDAPVSTPKAARQPGHASAPRPEALASRCKTARKLMQKTSFSFFGLSNYLPTGNRRLEQAPRRRLGAALMAAAALTLLPQAASAQAPASAFPGGPVTLIVPYAAGGLTDNLARALGQRLTEKWGQPVLVDNRAGGGTVIGTAAAARAPADGRTLLVTSFGFTTNQFMVRNLPYKQSALEPLALISVAPSILFVHPSVPANNIAELVTYMKSSPTPLTIASSGNGSSPHIAAELFASMLGIPITHVPYRGNGPAINDLLGGQVQALFDSKASLSYAKAGRLKALGVATLKKSSQAPDLTPIAQADVPALSKFTSGSWFGVLVPQGTPRGIQNRLYADIRSILETQSMQEAIDRSGTEPALMTQAEFAAYLKAESEKWGPIIREKNIRPD